MNAFATHGGRLSQARAAFPNAPSPWIDLSTGINPQPYPADFATAQARALLPDPADIAALEASAARAFSLPAASVLATSGAETAIRFLASILKVAKVSIVQPTYGGHAEAWRQAGAVVSGVTPEDLDAWVDRSQVIVVVNPNNPDGAAIPPERLLELGGLMAARDGWLIVDESFVEVRPELSVATQIEAGWTGERIIALRSFGKFYGLAGVRLGFVTAHETVVERLRLRQGDWPVSADAIAAGQQAYDDPSWSETARRWLAADAARLDGLLTQAGLTIVGGTDLFRLTACDDAADRFQRLARAGVLTRPFAYDPAWLRFGLPGPYDWARLEDALMETAP